MDSKVIFEQLETDLKITAPSQKGYEHILDLVWELKNQVKEKLQRWLELLETDGIDSKNMVAVDIQKLLEEIGKC